MTPDDRLFYLACYIPSLRPSLAVLYHFPTQAKAVRTTAHDISDHGQEVTNHSPPHHGPFPGSSLPRLLWLAW